jgi:hypothetical protein
MTLLDPSIEVECFREWFVLLGSVALLGLFIVAMKRMYET